MAPPDRKGLPGEGATERILLVPDAPTSKPAFSAQATTPGSVRAALVFVSVLFAHLVLGMTQPHAIESETYVWAMLAFAATAFTGVIGMYVQRAEGFRTILLTLQALFGLSVIILDSVYWVGQVMG